MSVHPMKIYGESPPPNWAKAILPQYNTPEGFNIPERECDYCPPGSEEISTAELQKLPNGLYICDDHPSARLRAMQGFKRTIEREGEL